MFLGCAEDIKEYNGKYGITQMLIELTRDCNLRCAYCPTSGKYAETGARRSEMTPAICRKAVDFFCSGNNAEKGVLSFYGGEPLLKFGLIRDTVEYVKQTYNGNKFSFSMTTNGTLLTEETMKFLIENDFLLSFSLDGPQPVNDRYREYAGDIHISGQHLLELINDILDLSKVESGMEELHEEVIDIAEIVQSVVMLVRQRAERQGVELVLELDGRFAHLRADRRKVKQILVNLLANAVKFTETGGRVTIKGWSQSESGCVFQVVDTGIGIALDDIPKALSQFGQIDSSRARQHEGTGLGLPLAKALIEMHGGSLDLQSKVGVGTTVTVRFPAERILEISDIRPAARGST